MANLRFGVHLGQAALQLPKLFVAAATLTPLESLSLSDCALDCDDIFFFFVCSFLFNCLFCFFNHSVSLFLFRFFYFCCFVFCFYSFFTSFRTCSLSTFHCGPTVDPLFTLCFLLTVFCSLCFVFNFFSSPLCFRPLSFVHFVSIFIFRLFSIYFIYLVFHKSTHVFAQSHDKRKRKIQYGVSGNMASPVKYNAIYRENVKM